MFCNNAVKRILNAAKEHTISFLQAHENKQQRLRIKKYIKIQEVFFIYPVSIFHVCLFLKLLVSQWLSGVQVEKRGDGPWWRSS